MQKDFWDKNAAQWSQVVDAGIFKSRKITNAAILNEIQRHKFQSLLDVGCHPCFALDEYRNGWNSEDFKSSGTEFSSKMPWYGRTLSSWVQVFDNGDFHIKEIIEPLSEGKPASVIFILRPNN